VRISTTSPRPLPRSMKQADAGPAQGQYSSLQGGAYPPPQQQAAAPVYAQQPAYGYAQAQPAAPYPPQQQPAYGHALAEEEQQQAASSNMEIPVGSVLGIPVRVHVLLPAITCLYTLNAWLISNSAAGFMFLLTGPVLYGARRTRRRKGLGKRVSLTVAATAAPRAGSVFLHELGHCLAARRVGGHVDGILLWCARRWALCRRPRARPEAALVCALRLA
jgi:hypothetical protein